jgi:predicted MFS family arabinose efflux permease
VSQGLGLICGPLAGVAGWRVAFVALAVLGVLVAAGGVVGISTRQFVDADMAKAFSGDE